MNSRIIDLTGDSSDVDPAESSRTSAKASTTNMPRAKRQPLKAVRNGARSKAAAPPKLVVSDALKKAIDTMDHMRLRMWVKHYCESMEPLRKDLEKSLLVRGKEVVRYHVDSDSEDDQDSENESSEEEEDSDESDTGEYPERKKKIKPIALADDELTPMYAKCLNCKEEFDVTANDRGDCTWHPGEKEVDYDCDFWADHDERCHGRIDSFIDDPDYAEGFTWSCCEKAGDDEGCKSTKHKAKVNIVCHPPPVVVSLPAPPSRKRKAEEEVARPVFARCENCETRYDVNNNTSKACRYHKGGKTLDGDSDFWADHDDDCHGYPESFIDDSDYDDGFMWSCCKEPMDATGCVRSYHKPKEWGHR